MYICNALLDHGFSAFSLSIIVYIDITDLSKEEARKLILEQEQYYIDLLKPEYNILSIAGSSLGYKHTEESLIKISKTHSGKTVSAETKALLSEALSGENHHGKTHSANTKAKMSLAMSGENHPRGMLGRTLSAETKAKISEAMTGENNPNFGKSLSAETKAKLSEINKGKTLSVETKAKLSEIRGTTIYIYSPSSEENKITLVNSLPSARKAAEEFNVSKDTILKYAKNGKLFKDKWILSLICLPKVNSDSEE